MAVNGARRARPVPDGGRRRQRPRRLCQPWARLPWVSRQRPRCSLPAARRSDDWFPRQRGLGARRRFSGRARCRRTRTRQGREDSPGGDASVASYSAPATARRGLSARRTTRGLTSCAMQVATIERTSPVRSTPSSGHLNVHTRSRGGKTTCAGVLTRSRIDATTCVGVLTRRGVGASTCAGVLTRLGVGASTCAGVLTRLGVGASTCAGVLTRLGVGASTCAGVLTRLGVGATTCAGVLTRLGVGASTCAGVLTRRGVGATRESDGASTCADVDTCWRGDATRESDGASTCADVDARESDGATTCADVLTRLGVGATTCMIRSPSTGILGGCEGALGTTSADPHGTASERRGGRSWAPRGSPFRKMPSRKRSDICLPTLPFYRLARRERSWSSGR